MCNVGKKLLEDTSLVTGEWKFCQKKSFCNFFPYDYRETFRQLSLCVSPFLFCLFFHFLPWGVKYFYRKISFTLLNVFLESSSWKRKEYSKPQRRNDTFWGHLLNNILALLCTFSQPGLSSLYLLQGLGSLSLQFPTLVMKWSLYCVFTLCLLPLAHSYFIKPLKYLSGFTRSLKVKTEH